jgi:WD40 repeat protein
VRQPLLGLTAKRALSLLCLTRSGVVLRLLFHPKQMQLYSGGDDGEVRVWDLVSKTCKATLQVRISWPIQDICYGQQHVTPIR